MVEHSPKILASEEKAPTTLYRFRFRLDWNLPLTQSVILPLLPSATRACQRLFKSGPMRMKSR